MGKNKQSRRAISADNSSRANRGIQQTHVYRKRVYDIVRRIPLRHVMTYGQIAIMLGEGYTPRTVGYVMHASEEEKVPWQRVINSQGACSTGRIILPPGMQQRMLESEGIKFDAQGRCDLNQYRWSPEDVDGQSADKNAEETPSLYVRRTSRIVKPAVHKKHVSGTKRKT